jgi:hypothetical protein
VLSGLRITNLPVFNRNEDLSFFYISELLEVNETFFGLKGFQTGISLLDVVVLKHFIIKELVGQAHLI